MRARNLPPLLVASAVFSLPLADMHLSAQGSLDPPGPPEPTQKSLQEIWDKLEAVESKNDTLQATVDALQATVAVMK